MSRLTTDAQNRALRTALQGLAVTVATAVVVVLLPVVSSARAFDDIDVGLVGFSLFQSVAVAALSYIMRAWLDASRVPTPLPPADPGEPDDDTAKDA